MIISGPSDVVEEAAGGAADGLADGCATGVVDDEACGGSGGATEEEDCAGASGALNEDDGVGCVADDAPRDGAAAMEEAGFAVGDGETVALREGFGTMGVLGTSGTCEGPATDDGVTVVY